MATEKTREVDIIITDSTLVKRVLEKLHSLNFNWVDGDDLLKTYDTMKKELESGNIFLTVYDDKTVEYDVNEQRDSANKSITDHDFLNSDIIQKQYDPVNSPSHYTDTRIQPIDVIDDWGLDFCLGNAIKYIKRAGHKKSGTLSKTQKEIQDLEKAAWYINHRIQLLTDIDSEGEYYE